MSAPSSPRFASFRAFSHRDYAAIWTGTLVSNIGTWMESIALGVHVTQVTGEAAWTGAVASLTYLPSLVLSPLGGVLADRFDRRAFLSVCVGAQALLAALLAALAYTDHLTVPAIAIVSLLNGSLNSIFVPAATGLIAAVVPAEDLHSALSLDSAQFNLGRIVGPALAALVLAAGGITWALLINALSFGAVLLAMTRVRGGALPAATRREPLWRGLADGARLAWEDPGIFLALLAVLGVGLLITPFIGLVPVFALRVLNLGSSATAMLVTAQGTGAVIAAFLASAAARRIGQRRLLEGALVVLGPATALYWLSPTLPMATAALFVLGAVYLLTFSGLKTVCQARAPLALQARISSLFTVFINLGYTVGVAGQAELADRLGVRLVTATAALGFFVLVLTTRALSPRGLASLGT
ncbi:MFS transporter [Corallococcus sp. H22C18031201]|uniref:MFS transporter n=1 Tax=Citreicoccus inhibens TaxID=2849499 RepID=UPI000E76142E|nr:MFS transporter [Citreicoccus inhibens]MBU8898133.1 MFS transporter [Citreicoccus inhibens]RJS18018.1 MFS transporter [Corallococcus sp. H22C18031201]